ncbi:Nitrogen regulatory protein area [Neofusicoccum parvum]|uniref:Nitrogen regulatory protein area n=1 Tax=Neofusicoccum parvum TaxID=310453 RepID=A0ACB5SHV0_9PEZI|nr:Nitrogen regulatory protein area [Neofusicoccum parvum]
MSTYFHFGPPPSSCREEVFSSSHSPSNIPSLTPASTLGSSVDASPTQNTAGDDVLEYSLFPGLKNDKMEDVEELQKEDPLGVDMWKFFKKQKQSRVPDAERMENMTWRMMSINLRKVQLQNPTQTTFSAVPESRLDAHSFVQVPDHRHQRAYASAAPPHRAHDPSGFHAASGYGIRNGPRGSVNVPPLTRPEPSVPAAHSRHVSLAAAYSNPPSFESATHVPGYQPAAHQDSYADVVAWDPGWAEDAFGGQPLYGPPAIKREEVEAEPSFGASGDLSGEHWLAQDAERGFVQQESFAGQFGSAQPGASEWQRFQENHYAELLEQKPLFGTHPEQYGNAIGGSDFGFEVSMSGAQGLGYQGQGVWGMSLSPDCVAAGRKRRKGQ